MRTLRLFALCVLACTPEKSDSATESPESTAASTTAPSASTSTSDASGSSSTGPGPTTTTGSGGTTHDDPTTGGDGVMLCFQGCRSDADCCLEGQPCPGPFPHNPTCDASGICRPAQCASDEECTFGGTVPGNECHPIAGAFSCFRPCLDDMSCGLPEATCTGVADDGAPFCETPQYVCESDGDCLPGLGDKCDVASGQCGCESDADCYDLADGKCRAL